MPERIGLGGALVSGLMGLLMDIMRSSENR